MRFVLKEPTPRQYNIQEPIGFLAADTPQEHKALYGTKSTTTSYFFKKKNTQTYDEWFKKQTNEIQPALFLTPLHRYFSVSSVNISPDYWDNFFQVHPYSALALYFHTKPFQKEKLTQIRKEGDRRNVYWQTTTPDIKKAIPLKPPPFHRAPDYQVGVSQTTGELGIIFAQLIPVHITFYSDAIFLHDKLPTLIFDFISVNFPRYRSFIASPAVNNFAESRIIEGYQYNRSGKETVLYKTLT